MPWILLDKDKGCSSNLLADLIRTDIPAYQNFVRIPPAFFYLVEERIHHRIKKSVTNSRKALEVGLKVAITLRYLATGETYTSLQYHWLVGHTTIFTFVSQILLNSRTNICTGLLTLKTGKRWRRSSERSNEDSQT